MRSQTAAQAAQEATARRSEAVSLQLQKQQQALDEFAQNCAQQLALRELAAIEIEEGFEQQMKETLAKMEAQRHKHQLELTQVQEAKQRDITQLQEVLQRQYERDLAEMEEAHRRQLLAIERQVDRMMLHQRGFILNSRDRISRYLANVDYPVNSPSEMWQVVETKARVLAAKMGSSTSWASTFTRDQLPAWANTLTSYVSAGINKASQAFKKSRKHQQ